MPWEVFHRRQYVHKERIEDLQDKIADLTAHLKTAEAALEQAKGHAESFEISLSSAYDVIAERDRALEEAWAEVRTLQMVLGQTRREEREEEAEELLDWIENWLTEVPTRYQIVLRRLGTTGEFYVGMRPTPSGLTDRRNAVGKTLRYALRAAAEEEGATC